MLERILIDVQTSVAFVDVHVQQRPIALCHKQSEETRVYTYEKFILCKVSKFTSRKSEAQLSIQVPAMDGRLGIARSPD